MLVERIQKYTLFRDERLYCAFPSLISCADGSVLLAFRVAPDEGSIYSASLPRVGRHIHPRSQIAITRLTEESLEASTYQLLPPDLAAADQDPSLHRLRSGRLLLSSFSWYPVTNGLKAALVGHGIAVGHDVSSDTWGCVWGAHVSLSDDHGKTWSCRTYVPCVPSHLECSPFVVGHSFCRTRGQSVELDDGTILVGCYAQCGADRPFESVIYASGDGGVSWDFRTNFTASGGRVGLAEPSLGIADDHSLIAYHRSIGGEDKLVVSRSVDGGKSWAPPTSTQIVGHPFSVLRLRNGSSVLVYARRHRPYCLCLCLLNSAGMPIAETEATLPVETLDRDFGYPSAIELTDGSLLIAYYTSDRAGVRYIAAFRVNLSS